MNRLLFILLISTPAFAQQAPKKANTIYVDTADEIEVVMSKYEKYLEEEGYIVRNKEDLVSLKTSAKEKYFGPGNSLSIYVEFLLEFEKQEGQTRVTFTGNYLETTGAGKYRPIINRGSQKMGVGLAWRFMNDLAIKYPSGNISYAIK